MSENSKKIVVGGCKSLDVISWGKQNNKHRFKCKNCGIYFTSENKSVCLKNKEVWFIIGKQTYEQISDESGYSVSTLLQRYFSLMLGKVPKLTYSQNKEVYLLIDGTYFSNEICLVVFRDDVYKQTQLYRITDGEHYEEMKEDLENILNLGIKIGGITCDCDKSLLKAIRKVCPKVPVQRCLVHIQRMCKIWPSAHPKSDAAFELREIVCKLHFIDNESKKLYWIKEFLDWCEMYKYFLNEKSYSLETGRYWYTHKMVRRCFSVIRKALPNMFTFLQNPKIPKTINGIESFFGHLKGNLNIHRELAISRRKKFIQWYLFYKNQKG